MNNPKFKLKPTQIKKNIIVTEGTVVQKINDSYVKVKIPGQSKPIDSYLSGRMFKNHIKVMEGDTVSIEIGSNDKKRGRVVFRKQPKKN